MQSGVSTSSRTEVSEGDNGTARAGKTAPRVADDMVEKITSLRGLGNTFRSVAARPVRFARRAGVYSTSSPRVFLAHQFVADEIVIGATQSTFGSAPSGSQDWVVDSTVAMIIAGDISAGSKAFGVTPPFHCVARR